MAFVEWKRLMHADYLCFQLLDALLQNLYGASFRIAQLLVLMHIVVGELPIPTRVMPPERCPVRLCRRSIPMNTLREWTA